MQPIAVMRPVVLCKLTGVRFGVRRNFRHVDVQLAVRVALFLPRE